ncbi:MAG: DUF2808 domain-containing protein [Hydrococcus sp. Prado102]|jgi:hypothetical protein|nr:DUF2808 domain-containing protein [Hydrococcus sp. Prado102]
MLRTLISIAAVSLAVTALNFPAYGNQTTQLATVPSLDGSVQYPRSNTRVVRHTFRVQIPEGSKAISQLKVSVPPGLTVRNDITVHERSGKELKTNTSVNENTVTINFPQPVEPDTTLEIDMNRVILLRTSGIWSYRVYAKLVDFEPELNLGVAQIRGHRP